MKSSPCYGCENRHETCHSNCEAYQKWHDESRKEKEDLYFKEKDLKEREYALQRTRGVHKKKKK